MNPQTMTCDECRDELARRKGWLSPGSELIRRDGTTCTVNAWTRRVCDGHYEHNGYDDGGTGSRMVADPSHPYPSTLDGAAGALPEGWLVRVNQEPRYKLAPHWLVNAVDIHEDGGRGYVMIDAEADDELTARYRLALACVLAMEKTT